MYVKERRENTTKKVQWKRKERPKKRWLDNISEDMKEYKMKEHMAREDKGWPITLWSRPIG